MHELDCHNAADYLRRQGWISAGESVELAELPGGVSNQVLYVGRPDVPGGDFVLKQARAQLRVADAWYCSVERIWREVEVLRCCEALLERPPCPAPLAITTPRILHEDRDNYAFAMTAAPRDHQVWKQQLLAGQTNAEIAAACGWLMGVLHAGAWHDASLATRFDDRQIFDQLRLDPYYRTVAGRLPETEPWFHALCDSVWQHRHTLVHADFSPKNLLVFGGGLMLLDFETGHYGDPAFDLGFFLTHLVLKAFHAGPRHADYVALIDRFWGAYEPRVRPVAGDAEFARLQQRGMQNLSGCAWSRLDGKSPVDYLHDTPTRNAVRRWCRQLFVEPSAGWPETRDLLNRALTELT